MLAAQNCASVLFMVHVLCQTPSCISLCLYSSQVSSPFPKEEGKAALLARLQGVVLVQVGMPLPPPPLYSDRA